MMNIYIHLLSAAGLALSVAGCDQSSTIGTGSSQSELSSLALLVDGSSKLARNYFTGRCGPLTVSYYSAERYPMAEATPGNEAAKKYAWFRSPASKPLKTGRIYRLSIFNRAAKAPLRWRGASATKPVAGRT